MQVKVTKNDETILQGLLNLGLLEWEPTLAAEMEELLDGEGRSSVISTVLKARLPRGRTNAI